MPAMTDEYHPYVPPEEDPIGWLKHFHVPIMHNNYVRPDGVLKCDSDECGMPWPCPTKIVLDRLDEVEKELEDLRSLVADL